MASAGCLALLGPARLFRLVIPACNRAVMHPFLVRALRLSAHLPGVEHDEHRLTVRGNVIANLCREPGALSTYCRLEVRDVLLQAEPEHFYITDHFRSWPAVLVRMGGVPDDLLANRLHAAWEARAPRTLVRMLR